MKKNIPYSTQYIDSHDIRAVIDVLKSGWLTQGSRIKKFEDALKTYCGAKYAVLFNSGTSSLHAAYYVSGLNKEDEFITSPMTFAATSNAGMYMGAKPVFSDIEYTSGNMDTTLIENNINKNTKLIVPVHYSGNTVNMKEINRIAKKYNLKVIEDACHALGSEYLGEKIGHCRYSDMTVFSFHPVKSITTGEGGAVLTNSKKYYEKLLMFRNHGITKQKFKNRPHGDWYYEMQFLGFNYRMTDIQAALGITQLSKLDKFIKKRRKISEIYRKIYKNCNFCVIKYFDIIKEENYSLSSCHLFPILLNNKLQKQKKHIFNDLKELGLGVQVHYIPVYFHPFYKEKGYMKGLCPVSEKFYKREISIPLFYSMTSKDIDFVSKTLINVCKKYIKK